MVATTSFLVYSSSTYSLLLGVLLTFACLGFSITIYVYHYHKYLVYHILFCKIVLYIFYILFFSPTFSFGNLWKPCRPTKGELGKKKRKNSKECLESFVRDPAILSDCFLSSVQLQLMRATAPSSKPVGKPSLSSCVGSKNNLLCTFSGTGFGYLLCWFTYLQ